MLKIISVFLLLIIPISGWAGIIIQNIQNGCDIESLIGNPVKIYAKWTPNSYTCAAGYFLPANAIECVKCSPDHTCPGGTFTFNENISQGITFNTTLTTDFAGGCVDDYLWPTNNHTKTYAKWEINSYDCSNGYYLPADGIECELCPENSYCSGGTYTYNETISQGIMDCPDEFVSPMGGYDIGSCGRKMHIGNEIVFMRSQKKTTPSLNIDINNDGIADFFGNLTQTRTVMNRASQHYLHIGDYYMYDDSIKIAE